MRSEFILNEVGLYLGRVVPVSVAWRRGLQQARKMFGVGVSAQAMRRCRGPARDLKLTLRGTPPPGFQKRIQWNTKFP